MVRAMWEGEGKDACYVDSGGPLVNAKGDLVGLVSWEVECAVAENPGVYIRVGSARDFVDEYL